MFQHLEYFSQIYANEFSRAFADLLLQILTHPLIEIQLIFFETFPNSCLQYLLLGASLKLQKQ